MIMKVRRGFGCLTSCSVFLAYLPWFSWQRSGVLLQGLEYEWCHGALAWEASSWCPGGAYRRSLAHQSLKVEAGLSHISGMLTQYPLTIPLSFVLDVFFSDSCWKLRGLLKIEFRAMLHSMIVELFGHRFDVCIYNFQFEEYDDSTVPAALPPDEERKIWEAKSVNVSRGLSESWRKRGQWHIMTC